MTAKLNLTIREGATFRKRLTWRDAKKRPVNLTGAVITAQLRDKPDGTLLLEFSEANSNLSVSPLWGQINFELSPAETADLTFKSAVWDLRVEFANGDVEYPIEGSVEIVRSTTE